MPLVTLRDISLAFGAEPLLDSINLTIETGEKIALLGRNGCGKSTLLKIVAGVQQADDGAIETSQSTRIASLAQELPGETDQTVFEVVASGLGAEGRLLAQYQHCADQPATDSLLAKLDQLHQQIDQLGAWLIQPRIDATISRLQLPSSAQFGSLSGGLRRRVLLARALVQEPDLLLLDEPTNHLDIEAIDWLEEFVKGFRGAVLLVTHDRSFMQAVATRVVEIERGRLISFPGSYENFLRRRSELLKAEAEAEAQFDKKLSQEEAWIRQGIKARRTRNEGRVRALKKMREERQQRRQAVGRSQLNLSSGERSGKLVVEATDLSYRWDGQSNRELINHFSTTILRGDRVGIIGPNGCGKSTLIKLLLGELNPTSGNVELGTKLQPLYFDQLRAALDENKSIADNVAEGESHVEVAGQRKHIIGYLQDFLFSPQRARTPVSALSGGERARVLLAKLFTRPGNLLVLDEPTNDLDIETLELLEELLSTYDGTLLLISHDRTFLNNLVTSTLAFEQQESGGYQLREYVGGYDDWLRQRPQPAQLIETETDKPPAQQAPGAKPQRKPQPKTRPQKLSYKLQRELEQLPDRIAELESNIDELQQQMASSDYFKQPSEQISAAQQRLAQLEGELEQAFERWEELEQAD